MNAFNCMLDDLRAISISTSSEKLDKALQNGIRLGTMTEINGCSGSFKTQLCLQLTINTILPEPVGLVDGEVAFISTKRNFCRHRVIQLVDACVNIWENSEIFNTKNNRTTFTRKEALGKIHHRLATSLPELIATIYQLQKFVEKTRTVSERLPLK